MVRLNLNVWVVVTLLLAAAGLSVPAAGDTHSVSPGESIQAAIEIASYGDTVEVSAGTYIEIIMLKNGVALIGAGASTTTIDGGAAGSVVTSFGCLSDTILEGFTIMNGHAISGGGMYNESSSPTVTGCTFIGNTSMEFGGGMYNRSGSTPTVTNCTFIGNTSIMLFGGGMCNEQSNPMITNCSFTWNNALVGGGMFNSYSSPVVTNCILWDNMPEAIYNDGGDAIVTYSDIQWGYSGLGNIDADPEFVDADGRLSSASPCVDAGDNSAPSLPATDLDGNPRVVDGDGDGTSVVDMGAYELQPQPVLVHNITKGLLYYSIQAAIDEADNGDEIEVAQGTCYEAINFNGKAVWLHSIDGPEVTTIDGTGYYHVVQCVSGEGADTILEGFTITGGNADGADSNGEGGGMRNESSSPTVTGCIFTGNSATRGGGMYNADSSSPTVTDCTFSDNPAELGGGGMYNHTSDPTLTNCIFSGNSANYGGGIFNISGNPTLNNCTFGSNTAGNSGGGMYSNGGSPTLTGCSFITNEADFGGGMRINESNAIVTDCIFSGNAASIKGGGIHNDLSSSPTLTNCTFSGNTADSGGGMYNRSGSTPTVTNSTFSGNSANIGGGMYNDNSSPTVTNCILWGNTPDAIFNNSSSPVVTYSDVEGGYSGTGNINADPCFVKDSAQQDWSDNFDSYSLGSINGVGGWQGWDNFPVLAGSVDESHSLSAPQSQFISPGTDSVHTYAGYLAGQLTYTAYQYISSDSSGVTFFILLNEYNDYGPYSWSVQLSFDTSSGVLDDSFVIGDENVAIIFDQWVPIFVNVNLATNVYEIFYGATLVSTYELPEGPKTLEAVDLYSPLESNVSVWYDDMSLVCNIIPTSLELESDSPCIDAGDNSAPNLPATDLAGNPRIVDGDGDTNAVVDMGAYEFQPRPIHNITQDLWYEYIQVSIDDADNGDEIEVAPGTYNEAIDFLGKAIRLYSSDGAEVTTIDATGHESSVVSCVSGEDTNTILEGFRITGGMGSPDEYGQLCGGGMRNESSSPTVTNCIFTSNFAEFGSGLFNYASSPTLSNCTFTANTADLWGAGLYNNASNPTVTDCTFSGNTASDGGGMCNSFSSPTVTNCTFSGNSSTTSYGGGMLNYDSSSPTLTNCTFSGNTASDGGGMLNNGSNAIVTNCTFSDNSAVGYGGGMYNDGSSPTLTNCIFDENTAQGAKGGGVANYNGSNSTITNCIFYNNSAENDIGGGIRNWESSPTVTNCILWDNEPDQISNGSSSPVVSYNDIQGGYVGTGNIDTDPNFVDANNPDPELVNLRLMAVSPCIDAGDSTAVPGGIFLDLDKNQRAVDDPATPDTGISVLGLTVDMGAYEFNPCLNDGDINCDGKVDLIDLSILAANWLEGV